MLPFRMGIYDHKITGVRYAVMSLIGDVVDGQRVLGFLPIGHVYVMEDVCEDVWCKDLKFIGEANVIFRSELESEDGLE